MASDWGIRIIVVHRVKRNQKSRAPSSRVFQFRRYGSATRKLGPRSLRMSAQSRKKHPDQKQALNTPERNQSSRWACLRAAKIRANPALRYKNPTKLGTEPRVWRCGIAGI